MIAVTRLRAEIAIKSVLGEDDKVSGVMGTHSEVGPYVDIHSATRGGAAEGRDLDGGDPQGRYGGGGVEAKAGEEEIEKWLH